MASTDRVVELLDTPIAIPSGQRALPLEAVKGTIEFEEVGFAYGGRLPILEHFNLHVPAGSTVGIVGATGSGKSTIVKLLLRLYEVQQGRILLDGQPITALLRQFPGATVGHRAGCGPSGSG
jgi:ATP-binding cassette subfamily B protein